VERASYALESLIRMLPGLSNHVQPTVILLREARRKESKRERNDAIPP
jgi:hypothetical protein